MTGKRGVSVFIERTRVPRRIDALREEKGFTLVELLVTALRLNNTATTFKCVVSSTTTFTLKACRN